MYGGAPPGSGPRRSFVGKIIALAPITGIAFALIGATGSLVHACPVTNLDCVVDETQTTIGGAQEAVQDTVEDTVGDVDETVDDTTETVDETVDETAGGAGDTVTDTIEDTAGVPDTARPDPGSGSDVSSDANASGGSGEPVEGARSGPGPGAGSAPVAAARGRDGTSGTQPLSALEVAAAASSNAGDTTPVAQASDPFDNGFTDAARRFAFPLVLSALVALYLFFQNRVDARDPKLALAPLDTEIILFE
jgi:hypothetical protein